MGVHDGHRDRMKKRFLQHGLDNFDDHSVLELLLFFALPRRDVNPIAHALLDKFGTLSEVFSAPAESLTTVDGVGENAALLISLIPQLCRRSMMSEISGETILNSSEKAGRYLVPRFFGERDEVVYLLCLDAKYKILNCRKMFRGDVNSAEVSVRKIIETALTHNATSVILAHNHTSGIAIPSTDDQRTTSRINSALKTVDIILADHIIVAGDDFVSMADSGMIK